MSVTPKNAGPLHEYLDCGHFLSPHSEHTTGYGKYEGKKYCYACCAERDKDQMRKEGKITLYLITASARETRQGPLLIKHKIINWPGSLEFAAHGVKTSKRGGGFGSQRTDAWFIFEGYWWHAVNRGDSQIVRCRKTKQTFKATA